MIETIEKVTDRLNPQLELDGILATMFDSRTLHAREVLERVVETFDEKVFDTVITRTVKLPDAQIAAQPILDYAPANAASEAYLKLARELVARKIVA